MKYRSQTAVNEYNSDLLVGGVINEIECDVVHSYFTH